MGINKECYAVEDFFGWLQKKLLPHCTLLPGTRSIVMLNNVDIHTNPRIKQAIGAASLLVRYLPPPSPIYSLVVSLLKA